MPTSESAQFRTRLFSLFLEKLKENSALALQYGETFEDAFGSLNYATAVRYEMLNAEKNERFKKLIPSGHTLLRWLQQGNFSPQVQSRSVTSVSRYLGYANFDEFRTSVLTEIESVSEQTVPSIQPQYPHSPITEELSFGKYKLFWAALGIVLISIVGFGLVDSLYSENNASIPSEEQLMQIIERSNAFEFQLYAQVGRKSMDTSGFHQIFTSDSPAWRAIEKVVHGSIEDEYTLDLERSHRALLSIELKQITDSTLVVGSREAWTIIWNSEIAPDTRYDEVNEQLYTLLNDNGHWKVNQNEYEGKYVVTEEKE